MHEKLQLTELASRDNAFMVSTAFLMDYVRNYYVFSTINPAMLDSIFDMIGAFEVDFTDEAAINSQINIFTFPRNNF